MARKAKRAHIRVPFLNFVANTKSGNSLNVGLAPIDVEGKRGESGKTVRLRINYWVFLEGLVLARRLVVKMEYELEQFNLGNEMVVDEDFVLTAFVGEHDHFSVSRVDEIRWEPIGFSF